MSREPSHIHRVFYRAVAVNIGLGTLGFDVIIFEIINALNKSISLCFSRECYAHTLIHCILLLNMFVITILVSIRMYGVSVR
jgi:hypothetical protein